MRKFLLLLVVLLLTTGALVTANAQVSRLQAREAEWKSYALPKTNFRREVNPEKTFVFRVPADWERIGTGFKFRGPHSSSLEVVIQKVPEGYPLDDYFAGVVRTVKDLTGGAESIVTRKTQLQDIEAREITLELPDPEGEIIRSTSWVTINGPAALVFNVQAPIAHAAEIEPFLKAVVQSVIFVGFDYEPHEQLRKTIVKTPAVSPIDEVERIVATLNDATTEREAAVTRLTALFSSSPDAALDLLLDRRPLVRVATLQAIARSNNAALTPTLWQFLADREPLVSEAAACALAKLPNIVPEVLQHSMSGFDTDTIAHVWPFMPKEKRNELLLQIFKEPAVSRPDPPPRVATGAKPKVSVSVVQLGVIEPGTVIKGLPPVMSRDPNVQIGALTLLITVPREEFKLPLTQLIASNYNPLIAVGLQVALWRGEALPVSQLLSLASSTDQPVSWFAVQNLAVSATTADIPRIETLISKDGSKKSLDDLIKRTIKEINFRQQLGSAKTEDEQREITRKGLADASLAEFAWLFSCEATTEGCTPGAAGLKRDVAIKSFAENLFPKRVKHYTAIPNPREAVQKFYETLNGLQMDSPRDQSNLVAMMINLRRLFGSELVAPYDADTLIDYTGIDPDSPIALGAWTPSPAPDSVSKAERNAIVLRVKDRARFERTLAKLQDLAGSLSSLTNTAAGVARGIAGLPAILPISTQWAFSPEPSSKPKTTGPLLRYDVVGDKEWNGLRVRTFEHTSIDSSWNVKTATTHVAYLGDVAIVATDLATIRELVANANGASDKQLAHNPEFRIAIDSQSDVVYFSDLKAVFADVSDNDKNTGGKLNERGSLKFSASSWENSHQFVFDESEWSKLLLPFEPKELTAPRELLPASTIAYFLTKVDLPALWASSSKEIFAGYELETLSSFWALDFKQEVLPELGPECGVVMLDLPPQDRFSSATFAAFCKLKSNKLAEALTAGKLFRTVGPTTGVAAVKFGSEELFFATRKGFLVVSNNAKGITIALDGKTNLATTRDYSRSVEKVPAGVVAFGGYNLQAAVAGVNTTALEGPQKDIANFLLSVTGAFHSQNFYATVTAGTISAHSSVAMDREGRYPIADFSTLRRGTNITYAVVEPSGVPITDQSRTSSLRLKVRAKAAGPIENIKDDIKTADQIVELKSPTELVVNVAARRNAGETTLQLPVKDLQVAEYLKATPEFAADKTEVIAQARQIAGNDRDAWSVARKLADWTHKNLEWKLVASADPVSTLATREADCTEFSALFVGMARSLGLPARTVSGLAYNGSSFGGHAWVEVWVGKWIELDPTWGTSFVDATHIRTASDSLLTSAGLNLLELEVLEAKRTVAEFQKSPRALAEHLAKAIPATDKPEIEAAIDVALLTDTHMGTGAWAKLNDTEREQMWSAYRRLLTEIILAYQSEGTNKHRIRVLHVEEKGDTAEAITLAGPVEMLVKFRFARWDGAWYLVEMVQADNGFAFASEILRPAISTIEKTRAGEKLPATGLSNFSRVLLLLERDAAKAFRVADELLKANPRDRGLRFLKAAALLAQDKDEEAEKLLSELSDEGHVPAVYRLADQLLSSEDEKDRQRGLELYQRYTTLEPHDPRGFRELGSGYGFDRSAEAEVAYRKAIELDPSDVVNYLLLIELFVLHDRIPEVRPLLVAGEKYQEDYDLFGMVFQELMSDDETEHLAKLAASEPLRMKKSMLANHSLGIAYLNDKRYAEAERLFNAAAQIDQKSSMPYVSLAMVYRKQSRWLTAVRAANQAISRDAEDSEAYYQKACALARLGRVKEGMAALTKSVELDEEQAYYIGEEKDLKPLASLPEFKKLLPPPEEPQP